MEYYEKAFANIIHSDSNLLFAQSQKEFKLNEKCIESSITKLEVTALNSYLDTVHQQIFGRSLE